MKTLKKCSALLCTLSLALGMMFSVIGSSAAVPVKLQVQLVSSLNIQSPLRNNFDGFMGIKLTVGASDLTVTSLGRMFFSGNAQEHAVKLVDAATKTDIPGGSVTVNMTGGTEQTFQYAELSAPVTLSAGKAYYLVSRENMDGDLFCDGDTQVAMGTAAVCSGWVFLLEEYIEGPAESAGHTFSGVSLQYEAESDKELSADQSMVTNLQLSPSLRNDFPGFIGAMIQTGNKPVAATALGRVFVAGNTQTHLVKLVNAATGADIPGGSVFVKGGAAGQIMFVNLPAPVRLEANTSYYVVSNEFAGGDQWYDSAGTVIAGTEEVRVTGQVFHLPDSGYNPYEIADTAYVPTAIRYALYQDPVSESGSSSSENTSSGNASSQDASSTPREAQNKYRSLPFVDMVTRFSETVRNDFTGWMGMKITVGANDLRLTSLGRMYIDGNEEHRLKVVDAATGEDIPGAAVTVRGGAPKGFTYGGFSAPVTLTAGKSYYILSEETEGKDHFYDGDSYLSAASVAKVNAWAFWDGSQFITGPVENTSFVLVDFKYQDTSTPVTARTGTISPMVSKFESTTLRNNFDSFIGIQIKVGSQPVQIGALGRMFAPGNQQSHELRLVDAETKQVVPGARTVVFGGTDGRFTYGSLEYPVTLQAGKTYYLLSREYMDGDKWYEGDSHYTTAGNLSVIGYAFVLPDKIETGGEPGYGFVGLDLKYYSQPEDVKTGESPVRTAGGALLVLSAVLFCGMLLLKGLADKKEAF